MKFNHNLLFIPSQYLNGDNPSQQALEKLQAELMERSFKIHITYQISDGLEITEKSPQYSGIDFYQELDNPTFTEELQHLTSIFRKRSATTPLMILSEQNITDRTPLDVLREVSRYVYLFSESATFAANRLYSLVHRHADRLLPPYFRALKDFIEDGDYYWDCPGHMGGMAYLKRLVGIKLVSFFGENMVRADIGVVTAEMGDYLIHVGSPRKSEEVAARLFGPDWTFYGVSNSLGSNRIVAQAAIGAGEVAIIDRNCHKPFNHGLTLSQVGPVYLRPTRNVWGLVEPIPTEHLKKVSIDVLVANSQLAFGVVSQPSPYVVVANYTYDSFCHNASGAVRHLDKNVSCIRFDEVWYAYVRFHPLYQSRYAMDAEGTPNCPTLSVVQPTHKVLPSLSMALMTHVKKSDRAPLSSDDFNDASMIHGMTSSYYPITASTDVTINMMEGESGYSLVQGLIEEAIAFRKAMVNVKRQLQEQEGGDAWFSGVFQPTKVQDSDSGQRCSFEETPISLLSHSADCWSLRSGKRWYGSADDDSVETNSMLDLVKVALTRPGIGPGGEYQKNSILGYLLTRFLDDHRTEIARTGDYTVLILLPVSITKGKWGTLIENLLAFEKHYDNDDLAADAIPPLRAHSLHYDMLTLRELCQITHEKMDELELTPHIDDAVSTDLGLVMIPTEVYREVIRYKTEHIRLDDLSGRIAASTLVSHPPGIPALMPDGRVPQDNKGITDHLRAPQEFDKQFPDFEHEIQGVNVDENGDFRIRAIVEEERDGQSLPGHVTFKHQASGVKKDRQQAGERTTPSDRLQSNGNTVEQLGETLWQSNPQM